MGLVADSGIAGTFAIALLKTNGEIPDTSNNLLNPEIVTGSVLASGGSNQYCCSAFERLSAIKVKSACFPATFIFTLNSTPFNSSFKISMNLSFPPCENSCKNLSFKTS